MPFDTEKMLSLTERLEGTLEAITGVHTSYVSIEGKGVVLFVRTRMCIRSNHGENFFVEYPGIILPDSVGHFVVIENRKDGPRVYDREIKRKYTISPGNPFSKEKPKLPLHLLYEAFSPLEITARAATFLEIGKEAVEELE